MSEFQDLPATAELEPVEPVTPAEAARLQAAYRRRRLQYRRRHPDRGHEIDARCVYLAPPELRVRIGGME